MIPPRTSLEPIMEPPGESHIDPLSSMIRLLEATLGLLNNASRRDVESRLASRLCWIWDPFHLQSVIQANATYVLCSRRYPFIFAYSLPQWSIDWQWKLYIACVKPPAWCYLCHIHIRKLSILLPGSTKLLKALQTLKRAVLNRSTSSVLTQTYEARSVCPNRLNVFG